VDAPARRRLSAGREADEAAAGAVFESLADPTRRTVLRAVAEEGPLTATELATRLPVTRQAVAKHLEVLRSAGLVTSAREGRDVRFSFDARPLDDAVGWIAAVGARWDRRLAALRDRVEGEGAG
jgi:DNA-binding transcriptional ArsR family regulator